MVSLKLGVSLCLDFPPSLWPNQQEQLSTQGFVTLVLASVPLRCRLLGDQRVSLHNAPAGQWLRGKRHHAGLRSLGAAVSAVPTWLAQHPPEPPVASGQPSTLPSPLSPATPNFLFHRTKAWGGPITVGPGQNSVITVPWAPKGCLGASGQCRNHLETCVTFLPGSGPRSAPAEVSGERAICLHLHPPGACRMSL